MLALVLVVVVGVVWARRRWTRRRVVEDGADASEYRATPPTQAVPRFNVAEVSALVMVVARADPRLSVSARTDRHAAISFCLSCINMDNNG